MNIIIFNSTSLFSLISLTLRLHLSLYPSWILSLFLSYYPAPRLLSMFKSYEGRLSPCENNFNNILYSE